MRVAPRTQIRWSVLMVAGAVIGLGLTYLALDILPDRILVAIIDAIPFPENRGDEVRREQVMQDPITDEVRSAEFKKRLEEIFFVSCTESAAKCLQSERMILVMRGYCLAEMNHLEQYTSSVLNEYDAYTVVSDVGQKMGSRLCHDERDQP